MSAILLDHIHLRASDSEAVAGFLSRHFDVEITGRMEVRGLPRVTMCIGEVAIFVEGATATGRACPAGRSGASSMFA